MVRGNGIVTVISSQTLGLSQPIRLDYPNSTHLAVDEDAIRSAPNELQGGAIPPKGVSIGAL